jgi:hypothetical protein
MSNHLALAAVGAGPASGGTLILDQFTDANGTNLTAHAIAPTNTPAASWATVTGTGFTVQGNKAQPGGANTVDAADAGQANVTVSADLVFSNISTTDGGLAVRLTDASNCWFPNLTAPAGNVELYENASGTVTLRAQQAFTFANSTTYTLAAALSGSTITVSVNGTQQLSYGSATSNQTATKHGPHCGGSGGTALTFDNFQVTQP